MAVLQNSLLIVGAASSCSLCLPLTRRVTQGFPALLTACVVYAYISTNTVKCLLSGRVLPVGVCVCVCARQFGLLFLDLEFYFIAVKTLCYIMFIYFKICAKRGCIFNKKSN